MVMKVYSPEFKADAVALYLSDPNHTYEGVGKDLGVSRETRRSTPSPAATTARRACTPSSDARAHAWAANGSSA